MGMTKVVLRYLPNSYGKLRPIQKFFGNYSGLHCENCGKDVLASSVNSPFEANLIWAKRPGDSQYEGVHIACKQPCDGVISDRLSKGGFVTHWERYRGPLQSTAVRQKYHGVYEPTLFRKPEIQ